MARIAKYEKTFSMARQMDKNKLAAARIRCRFLQEHIDLYLQFPSPISDFWADEAQKEIDYLLLEAVYETVQKKEKLGGITDADIARAREYPVEGMVEWTRHKATAWCHADRTPSLYFGSRANKIICPVCDKKFNAVDILISRDGYTFLDAVKALR